MRASRVVLALTVVVIALVGLARPVPVKAECPYFVIPPATEAARSAREVIVGTVIENVGGSAFDFRLRVDQVLRESGRVGEVRRFTSLYPGWPFDKDGDGNLILTSTGKPFPPCEPIPGWKGNVIALAIGALASDGKTRYNAASWIHGSVPFNRDLPTTTLARMQAIAALPPTHTVAPSSSTTTTVPAVLALGIGASSFAVAMILLGGRASRRRRA